VDEDVPEHREDRDEADEADAGAAKALPGARRHRKPA
jgi:hypothetical protein